MQVALPGFGQLQFWVFFLLRTVNSLNNLMVCDGDMGRVQCPHGQIVNLVKLWWGQPTRPSLQQKCGIPQSTCRMRPYSISRLPLIAARCRKNNWCLIQAVEEEIAEYCVGKKKLLVVQFNCYGSILTPPPNYKTTRRPPGNTRRPPTRRTLTPRPTIPEPATREPTTARPTGQPSRPTPGGRCPAVPQWRHAFRCSSPIFRLVCPPGKLINLQSVTRGAPHNSNRFAKRCGVTSETCGLVHIGGSNLGGMRSACDKKRTCTVNISHFGYSDPCRGQNRIGLVRYQCLVGGRRPEGACRPRELRHQQAVCAPKVGVLRCPPGQILLLRQVRWGRPPPNSSQRGKCHLDRRPCSFDPITGGKLEIMKSQCQGRPYCYIRAHWTELGTACPRHRKVAVVDYSCLLTKSGRTPGQGQESSWSRLHTYFIINGTYEEPGDSALYDDLYNSGNSYEL